MSIFGKLFGAQNGPSNLLSKARAAERSGNKSAALNLYEEILTRFPNSSEARQAKTDVREIRQEQQPKDVAKQQNVERARTGHETPSPRPSSATHERKETSRSGVRLEKIAADGSSSAHKGDPSDLHAIFSLAQIPYNSVMAASRTNGLSDRHATEIMDAVDLFTKAIELDGSRGEPYGQRANMYFIYAQIRRDRSLLDKAESDYRTALRVGASDPSNHAGWRNMLSQVDMVRSMI